MAGTGIVWPADAVSGAPSYTGRMLRNTQAPFLAGATAARPLGALSGVRPGTPSNTVAATSSVLYTVTPFAGIIDLETAAISGPYAFAFNANVTGAITAAGGTPRQDAVYVQINDAAESDGTVGAPNIKIDYLAGTVNSGGTLVIAAVPPRSFVIAYINVPTSGGGSPTVTWAAPYAVAAGAVQPVPSAAGYPTSPYSGQYADDAAQGVLVRSSGAAWSRAGFSPWVSYSPTLTNLSEGTGGAALKFAEWRYEGDSVHVKFAVTLGTTGGAFMGTIPTMALPVPAVAFSTPNEYLNVKPLTLYDVSANQTYEGRISAIAASTTTVRLLGAPGTGVAQPITAASPFSWAAGDQVVGEFTYRVA